MFPIFKPSAALRFIFLILKYLFVPSFIYCFEPDYIYCTYSCNNGIYSIKFYLPTFSLTFLLNTHLLAYIMKTFMGFKMQNLI